MKDDALIQLTRLIPINHHYSITNSTTINQAVLTTPHSYLPSFTTISPLLPSGKLTGCELENGPIEIVDLIYPLKAWWICPSFFVCLSEDNPNIHMIIP